MKYNEIHVTYVPLWRQGVVITFIGVVCSRNKRGLLPFTIALFLII